MSRVNIDSTLLGVGTRGRWGGGGSLGEYGQEKKRQQVGVIKGWEVGEIGGKHTLLYLIFCNQKRAKGRKPRKQWAIAR